ncbi:MAG: hypothetical protein BJBARM5_0472 [Candidatus Parvarchaeum acidophilus ARMAN-5]|uniref:Extracellular solute-binding protein family 1 n=1 Tax=Candidatus Parvarchaeum acidophilus ARMAN-5 TaxID=662762 RepID=D6GVG0_PARA5|nr:MAG: hypothetical protein BJBARM5_0472 [Candidatus Parvarchaeum acidophilus ARMAN-5]
MSMEKTKTPNNKVFSSVAVAVIIVVAIIFFFIGYVSHVPSKVVSVPTSTVKPVSFSPSSTIGVYDGPAGMNNSEHLIGGDVFAIPKGATNINALDTVITFFTSVQAQDAIESLGWPSIDKGTTNSTLPTYNGPAVTVNYYDDLGVSASATQVMENELIPEFEHLYPKIKINWIQTRPNDITEDIEALVLGNDVGATVIAQDNLDIGTLFYAGDLMNITNASTVLPTTLVPSMAGLIPYEQKTYGGVYFLPYRANIPLVWYNVGALKSLGITPPQNWSQLITMGSKLIAAGLGGISMQGHGGASTSTEMFQWMVQAGGNPLMFNDSGDVAAYYFMYNMSAYFSPAYTHDYWASYKGLNNNEYNFFDYQWPGSLTNYESIATTDTVVNTLSNGTTLYNTSAVQYAMDSALQQGAFFRPPVAWLTEWNTLADEAFTSIVTNKCGGTCTISSIQSILSTQNTKLYKYLATTYNTTYANQYENGVFTPLTAA